MKLVKLFIPIAVLLLVGLGCDLSRFASNNAGNNARPTPKPVSSVGPVSTPEPAKPEKSVAAAGLDSLRKTNGKYPYEVKLLDNADLKARLQKLLGPDYAALKANWNVESPIEMSGDVLMASACQQHNCGDNTYYLFIDFSDDNINVIHLEHGKHEFDEKGRIQLPKKFADTVSGSESDQ